MCRYAGHRPSCAALYFGKDDPGPSHVCCQAALPLSQPERSAFDRLGHQVRHSGARLNCSGRICDCASDSICVLHKRRPAAFYTQDMAVQQTRFPCCRSLSVPVWESTFNPHPTQFMVLDGFLTPAQFHTSCKGGSRGLYLETDGQQLVGRSRSGKHMTLCAAALVFLCLPLAHHMCCRPPLPAARSCLHAVNQFWWSAQLSLFAAGVSWMWDLSQCLGWQEGRFYNVASGFCNGAWLQPVVSMLAFLQSVGCRCSNTLPQSVRIVWAWTRWRNGC